MYDKTVTIFNYYESVTTGNAYWYPHVLSGVDLITDKGAILKKYGPDATDNAQLHIRYTDLSDNITIIDKNGKILPYVPPKEWKRQINNALEDTITFSEESFFWQGEWTAGMVDESNYRNGFYQHMNQSKDNVFKITSVGGPYTIIPHFEILGK